MAYFTYSDLATYTGKTYSTAEQTFITTVLEPAVRAAIEAYTGRKFGVSGDSASTRYYFGNSQKLNDYSPTDQDFNADNRDSELLIDEFISISSVTEVGEDGTETALTLADIEQLPLNTSYKNRLYLKSGASFLGYKYKVVGVLGSSGTVPEEIKVAALQIASGVTDSVDDKTKESIEGYTFERATEKVMFENPFVMQALGKWRKVLI